MQNKSKHDSLKIGSFSKRKRKTYLSFPIAGKSYCETRRIFKCFALLHEDTITVVCRRHVRYHNDHITYMSRDVNRAKLLVKRFVTWQAVLLTFAAKFCPISGQTLQEIGLINNHTKTNTKASDVNFTSSDTSHFKCFYFILWIFNRTFHKFSTPLCQASLPVQVKRISLKQKTLKQKVKKTGIALFVLLK